MHTLQVIQERKNLVYLNLRYGHRFWFLFLSGRFGTEWLGFLLVVAGEVPLEPNVFAWYANHCASIDPLGTGLALELFCELFNRDLGVPGSLKEAITNEALEGACGVKPFA